MLLITAHNTVYPFIRYTFNYFESTKCIIPLQCIIYTVLFTWLSGYIIVSKLVRISFIKTLLLVLRIAPSKLHIYKGTGARQYFIALSKSTHFPLWIEIARSLPMMFRLTSMLLFFCLFLLLSSMHLFSSLNNCVLLWVTGLWKSYSAHDSSWSLNSE